MKISMIKDN